jgi:NADH-quinone oxidoreductase subunit J
MESMLFWVLATIAVTASLLVIAQRNPMYSVLLLIVSFAALSGLYVLLQAPFVAVIQIIIYAGAIMVLFLFVVMLLNVPTEESAPARRWATGAGPRRFGAVLSAVLAAELYWAISSIRPTEMTAGVPETTVHDIGVKLFREYSFAFEVTSVLILVAMVGAIVIARKEPPRDHA